MNSQVSKSFIQASFKLTAYDSGIIFDLVNSFKSTCSVQQLQFHLYKIFTKDITLAHITAMSWLVGHLSATEQKRKNFNQKLIWQRPN